MYGMKWRYGSDVQDELEVWERSTGRTGGMGEMYRMNWRYGRDLQEELEVWERCTGGTGGMGEMYGMNWRYGSDVQDELEVWKRCTGGTGGMGVMYRINWRYGRDVQKHNELNYPHVCERINQHTFCSNIIRSLTFVFSHHWRGMVQYSNQILEVACCSCCRTPRTV